MPQLTLHSFYYIIKAAGENTGSCHPDFGGKPADVDLFVATNRSYYNKEDAERVAQELAIKTPGNRYYVAKGVSGFMAEPVKLHSRKLS